MGQRGLPRADAVLRRRKMADVTVGKDKCGEQRLVSLPLSRIRVIMKSSPEVSSINQEALVLTAKATVRRPALRAGAE
jgi:chromatin accessibility complex protein 1